MIGADGALSAKLLYALSVEEYAVEHTLFFGEVERDGRYAKKNVWNEKICSMV